VKDVLQRTHSTTSMRADGQAVIVSFGTYAVEVVPAFLLESTRYWICDTNDGGKFKTIDPVAEIVAIQASDLTTGGKTRNLIRMNDEDLEAGLLRPNQVIRPGSPGRRVPELVRVLEPLFGALRSDGS
jgi:hypothetical protein